MNYTYSHQKELIVSSPRFPPFSTDPLDIDAMIHHIAFTSVYSTLVSNYKRGELKGIIAKTWNHNDDYTQWNFVIRTGMNFEDQIPITSEIVYKNFLRVAYKMKQSKSESGFMEFLVGIDKMQSASDSIGGIKQIEDTIQFTFTKPIPRLVTLISFGLYSIVSPKMYHPSTGNWLNPKAISASGPYSVINWSDTEIQLKLRQDYPTELRHKSAFESIKIRPNTNNNLSENVNLIIGFSDQNFNSSKFNFYGPVNSVIRHIRCYHWDDPRHFMYYKENRIALRDLVYSQIENSGLKVIRSFLPTQIQSVKQFTSSIQTKISESNLNLKLPSGMQTHDTHSIYLPIQMAFLDSLKTTLANYNGKIEFVDEIIPLRPDQTNADIRLMLTDILIDSPMDDLRFMFLSTHGIRLPDPTGKIREMVKKPIFNIQELNKQLWDDAIIWPLSHVAFGFWVNKDFGVDFSIYNASISPVDFRWIGSIN